MQVMIEKPQVLKSLFVTYFGVYGLFMTVYLAVILDSGFYLSVTDTLVVSGVSAFFVAIALFNVWVLRRSGFKISIGAQQLKNVKLIPMASGFALMIAGVCISAVSNPVFLPDGAQTGLFSHPFAFQGWALFFVGIGIQLLELVWYYNSVAGGKMDVQVTANA